MSNLPNEEFKEHVHALMTRILHLVDQYVNDHKILSPDNFSIATSAYANVLAFHLSRMEEIEVIDNKAVTIRELVNGIEGLWEIHAKIKEQGQNPEKMPDNVIPMMGRTLQ